MANCVSKRQKPEKKPPEKSFEEHSYTKRHLRLGVTFEKTADGEFHAGVRSGIDVTRDKKVIVDLEEKESELADNEDNEKIPRIVDLVMDQGN